MELINENKNSEDEYEGEETIFNGVTLEIPSIPETYTFSRKCYDPDILSKVLSKSEFDKIINKASIIYGDCLLKKKKADKFEAEPSLKVTRPLSLIFLILFVIMFYIGQSSYGNLVIFIISLVCILGSIGVTIFEGLKSYCRKNRKYSTLQEIIEKDLLDYCDEVNQKLLQDGKAILFTFNSNNQSLMCKVSNENEDENNDDNFFNVNRNNANRNNPHQIPTSKFAQQNSNSYNNNIINTDNNDSMNENVINTNSNNNNKNKPQTHLILSENKNNGFQGEGEEYEEEEEIEEEDEKEYEYSNKNQEQQQNKNNQNSNIKKSPMENLIDKSSSGSIQSGGKGTMEGGRSGNKLKKIDSEEILSENNNILETNENMFEHDNEGNNKKIKKNRNTKRNGLV